MTEETRPENNSRAVEPVEAEPAPPEGIDPEKEALAPADQPAPLEELERRLAEPVLRGQEGIEVAQVWISAFLIGLVTVIVYSNAFTGPLIGEDRAFIEQSAGLRHFALLDKALEAMPGKPVAAVDLAVNAWITGGTPTGLRAGNILVHAFNGILLYLLARRLLKGRASEPVAMLAGLLLALHPLAAGAVNFVVGRDSLLALMFSLLSILLYFRATDSEEFPGVGAMAGSLVCMTLALGSSPIAVSLPLMVVAGDLVVRKAPIEGARRVALLLYVAASLGVAVAGWAAYGGVIELAPSNRWMTVLVHRFIWMVAPENLSPHHTGLPESGTGLPAWQSLVMLLIVGGLLPLVMVTLLGTNRSVGGFALAWLLAFSWTSVQLVPAEFAMVESNAYLPLAGIALLFPWLFTFLPSSPAVRTGGGILAAVLVGVLGILTFNRNNAWESEEVYWRQAVAAVPNDAVPHAELGRLYLDRGKGMLAEAAGLAAQNESDPASARRQEANQQFQTAEQELQLAAKAAPDAVENLYNLGEALEYLGKPTDAVEVYRRVLRIDPEHSMAAMHMAVALEAQALQTNDRVMLGKSIALFESAFKRGKLPPEFVGRYAQALSTVGEYDRSIQLLSGALAGRDDPAAQATLQRVSQAAQAINSLRQQVAAVAQANPISPQALAMRGRLLAAMGHTAQASYLLAEALAQNPQDAGVWVLLGAMEARLGAYERFLQEHPVPPPAPTAPEGQPQLSTWQMLAVTTASEGLWDPARFYLEAAVRAGDPSVKDPQVALGEIAGRIGQPALAMEYLKAAAEAKPADPSPWLVMADVALALNDPATARAHLEKAVQRNAPPEEVEKRRVKLGDAPAPPSSTGTAPVIIR